MTSEIILAIVVGAVIVSGCIVIFGLLRSVRDSSSSVQAVTSKCMDELQTNHARVQHNMEQWHRVEIQQTRSHMERLLALQTVPMEDRNSIANTHAQERHHESELEKSHVHNSRMADLHETMATKESEVKIPQPAPPARKPVERSAAVKARAAINEGKIPARH